MSRYTQARQRWWAVGLWYAACLGPLLAQTGVTVLGAGYVQPGLFPIAPGQVLTLFVKGLDEITLPGRIAFADGLPLPTTLAGVSVELKYSLSGRSLPVPIFRIEQGSGPSVSAVTVHIPFDLKLPSRNPWPRLDPDGPPHLIVSQKEAVAEPFPVMVVPTNIHLLNACDETSPDTGASRRGSEHCWPAMVAHTDGEVFWAANPATTGETVIAYAWGLGNTNGGVKAGNATAADAPLTDLSRAFRVCYEFLGARFSEERLCKSPDLVRLTPGYAGLYEVHFQLPELPRETPACLEGKPTPNVTVTLTGGSSDQAKICVNRRPENKATPKRSGQRAPSTSPAVPAGLQWLRGRL